MSLIKKMARKILFGKKESKNKPEATKPSVAASTAETPSAAETIAKLAQPSSEKKAFNPASEKKPGRPKSQGTKSANKKPAQKKPSAKKNATDK